MAEIVGDVGLLCPAGDVQAFSDALARIVDDDDLHGELTRRGPERAAQFQLVELRGAPRRGLPRSNRALRMSATRDR